MMPWCEYNNYQYVKVIADRLEAANISKIKANNIQYVTALNEIHMC
ncbi:MAG: hypothetical protein ACR5KW_01065 [Wolbachia sp.]